VKRPDPKIVPPIKRVPHIVEGRPFLIDGDARLASIGSEAEWADCVSLDEAALSDGERDALVKHYTSWALAEHASIASFARFGMQLLALGAPSDLIRRTIDAMGDEVRHARFGFGLASAIAGASVGPGELSMDGALGGELTLESVLRLVVREGMIGETLAALELRNAADLIEVEPLKREIQTIAEDESRHAELAYAFAAWAIAKRPDLARVVQQELAGWESPPLPTEEGLERWGILDQATRRSVRDSGLAQMVKPLVEQVCNLARASDSPAAASRV
jgi:hypothetical protein